MSEHRWREVLQHPGRERWKSVTELLDDPEARERIAREFPDGASDDSGFSRRRFLQLLGASAALAGAACTRAPKETILPYTKTPTQLTPGKSLRFSTSMTMDGLALGVMATSIDAHPIKLDGHPDHPATLGGSCPQLQAALLDLYDPMRAGSVQRGREPSTWDAFFAEFRPDPNDPAQGANFRVLMEPTSSPLTESLLARLRERFPRARVYFHAPFPMNAPLGLKRATGQALQPRFDLTKAEVVLSIGGDPLNSGPFGIRYARDFASGRRMGDALQMNRLYAIDSSITPTGIVADHRLALRPSRFADAARSLFLQLVNLGASAPDMPKLAVAPVALEEQANRFLAAAAKDLLAHAGKCAVITSEDAPADLHALVYALNTVLGNTGKTVFYAPSPILEVGEPSHDLAALTTELQSGAIDHLLVLGGNPAFTAPPDVPFASALEKVKHVAVLTRYANETTRQAAWLLAETHFLEAWDDARALDGTVSFTQPLIEPLADTKCANEILARLAGLPPASPYQRLKDSWSSKLPAGTTWDAAIQQGFLANSAFPTVTPTTHWDGLGPLFAHAGEAPSALELQVRPDPKIRDGRFANNAWLQELPHPATKQTWGNAALISPQLAASAGVTDGQIVRLAQGDRHLEIPALVLPGQDANTITVDAGYGHLPNDRAEYNSDHIGHNAYFLKSGPVTLDKIDRHEQLAITQDHWSMEGREIAIEKSLDELKKNPHVRSTNEKYFTLYQPPSHEGPQWAMAIDLTTCTGCSACVLACQAENNIPVVGFDGVVKSREMHWIRIDRYFAGTATDPAVLVQPMLCQQCEKAPCEYVCPVNATTHSPDGINEMTYNRCVGTRFCSNNCPYKVRRFNWFHYNTHVAPSLQLSKNPQVTVRARGVMEKCNFCIQRIRNNEIVRSRENRPYRDGEVNTACAEACPTGAITFGNLRDPASRVAKLVSLERAYKVLEDLGTEPRVRYVARVRNENAEVGG